MMQTNNTIPVLSGAVVHAGGGYLSNHALHLFRLGKVAGDRVDLSRKKLNRKARMIYENRIPRKGAIPFPLPSFQQQPALEMCEFRAGGNTTTSCRGE